MSKYQLRFWFEHGGICIWGINEKAKEKYGYAINNHSLPIPEDLIKELDALEREYATYLDWDFPQDPSPWTQKQKNDFLYRANLACEKLKNNLFLEFEIQNEANLSIK